MNETNECIAWGRLPIFSKLTSESFCEEDRTSQASQPYTLSPKQGISHSLNPELSSKPPRGKINPKTTCDSQTTSTPCTNTDPDASGVRNANSELQGLHRPLQVLRNVEGSCCGSLHLGLSTQLHMQRRSLSLCTFQIIHIYIYTHTHSIRERLQLGKPTQNFLRLNYYHLPDKQPKPRSPLPQTRS